MNGTDALGLIMPNMHDENLLSLTALRAMGAVPFGARYRLVDFPLSAMVGAGISNVGMVVKQNYRSLMTHVGSGREWDLARKLGGIMVFPPFAEAGGDVYHGRVSALAQVADHLAHADEKYVVMADCDVVAMPDLRAIVSRHAQSGAAVTLLYSREEIPSARDVVTLDLAPGGAVTALRTGDRRTGPQNVSMNLFVAGREVLLDIVNEAASRGYIHFERDALAPRLGELPVRGEEYTGFCRRIYSMGSFYAANMALLEKDNLDRLFRGAAPVRTRVHDEAPVRYTEDGTAQNCLLADGCVLSGRAENSVLFRGVKIGDGASVQGCVLMQGAVVGPGAQLVNCVLDKNVTVGRGKRMVGDSAHPAFLPKNAVI